MGKTSKMVEQAPQTLKQRPELVRWFIFIGLVSACGTFLLGFFTGGNYTYPSLIYVGVGFFSLWLTQKGRVTTAVILIICVLTFVDTWQGYVQHSGYVLCILGLILVGTSLTLPEKYITIIFGIDCGIIGVFLITGVLTWTQNFPQGSTIALVNNVSVLLPFLLCSYVFAKIIARILVTPLIRSEELLESKSRLLAFAAHELKTPLVPIFGWADLMADAQENGLKLDEVMGPEEVATIKRNAERLQEIIDEFLLVGISEGAQQQLTRERVHLPVIIEEAIDAVRLIAEIKAITFETSILDIELDVDPFRIKQVFINILTNAVKYSPPESQIEISATVALGGVEILVRDHGAGLTPEEVKEAFQPFSLTFLRKKEESAVAGSGVGLYLSKNFVEQHGGTISIHSAGLNSGATVKVCLPTPQE
jgi:signal transduction histidine kinase